MGFVTLMYRRIGLPYAVKTNRQPTEGVTVAEKPSTQQIIEYLSIAAGVVTFSVSHNLIAAALAGSIGALGMYKKWSEANLARRKELSKEALRHAVSQGTITADDAAKLLKEMS